MTPEWMLTKVLLLKQSYWISYDNYINSGKLSSYYPCTAALMEEKNPNMSRRADGGGLSSSEESLGWDRWGQHGSQEVRAERL